MKTLMSQTTYMYTTHKVILKTIYYLFILSLSHVHSKSSHFHWTPMTFILNWCLKLCFVFGFTLQLWQKRETNTFSYIHTCVLMHWCQMAAVGTWSFSRPAVERMRCMLLAGQHATDVVETAMAGTYLNRHLFVLFINQLRENYII